jgi:hypothetical protein
MTNDPSRPAAGIEQGKAQMNIALRHKPPPDIDQAEPLDDERNRLSALLRILPPLDDGEDDERELVSVIMVGRGDHFMQRARDYQQRHAQAQAEWDAWDEVDEEARGEWVEWSDAHGAKLDELCDKYDLGTFTACDDTRFRIVEVLEQSGLIV